MAKIVYLDDEYNLTDIFKLFFEDTEHEVNTFTNEAEAITYCQQTPPDILVVDYRLTTMKGDEVAAQVPETISKILVTGDIKIESNYSFNAIIEKPFKLHELMVTVERVANET